MEPVLHLWLFHSTPSLLVAASASLSAGCRVQPGVCCPFPVRTGGVHTKAAPSPAAGQWQQQLGASQARACPSHPFSFEIEPLTNGIDLKYVSYSSLELALFPAFSEAVRASSFLDGWDRAQPGSFCPGKALLRRAQALAEHHSQSLPTCRWPPYLVSFSTRRGQTWFLFSFISISNVMSQREMICRRREQKKIARFWRIRKRLERSGYWGREFPCGSSGAQSGAVGGDQWLEQSASTFRAASRPRESWERELGAERFRVC